MVEIREKDMVRTSLVGYTYDLLSNDTPECTHVFCQSILLLGYFLSVVWVLFF